MGSSRSSQSGTALIDTAMISATVSDRNASEKPIYRHKRHDSHDSLESIIDMMTKKRADVERGGDKKEGEEDRENESEDTPRSSLNAEAKCFVPPQEPMRNELSSSFNDAGPLTCVGSVHDNTDPIPHPDLQARMWTNGDHTMNPQGFEGWYYTVYPPFDHTLFAYQQACLTLDQAQSKLDELKETFDTGISRVCQRRSDRLAKCKPFSKKAWAKFNKKKCSETRSEDAEIKLLENEFEYGVQVWGRELTAARAVQEGRVPYQVQDYSFDLPQTKSTV
ncbi:hypothetical protein BS50DRAFT_592210 [Corynespora cassiicola Philippines]|uniref:Uncharacterized protein n=1 Tax=Corynespora cassiicola Philippines TaxID=1448308 RepID=A0A2T2N982_CORCC|nr:hypothetical protein BS50DRAFT_592210 [Corynespora cassiicola Philippines]